MYFISQVILLWRSLLLTQKEAAWGATAVLFAVALPMMAVGTRRFFDAGLWRWGFVAVFLFGIVAQVIYMFPLPHETSVKHLMVQLDDQTVPISDLGYFPFLQWLRNAMPWIGYPAGIICLLLALLPTQRQATPAKEVLS